MTPLPPTFRALLRDANWHSDQTAADLAEGSRIVAHLLHYDRCVAFRSRKLCGKKGGPICAECQTSFARRHAATEH